MFEAIYLACTVYFGIGLGVALLCFGVAPGHYGWSPQILVQHLRQGWPERLLFALVVMLGIFGIIATLFLFLFGSLYRPRR